MSNDWSDPHLDDHEDDPSDAGDRRLTLNTDSVQAGWEAFQLQLDRGEVEYVDLDDFHPPADATEGTAHLRSPTLAYEPASLSGQPTMVHSLAGYTEHASAAIRGLNVEMTRVGAENDGAVGNTSHTYGYHLSPNRLAGTGKAGDYSLQGDLNRPWPDNAAAAAQDIGMSWPASRQWIKWLFAEYAAGRLPHCTEIIGSIDGQVALYAATSTGRKTVRYTGTGHVAWSHVAHGRRFSNITTWGKEVLGSWSATGRIGATESEADMSMVALAEGRAAIVVRGTDHRIYTRILDSKGKPAGSWVRLDVVVASGVDATTRTGKDLRIVGLDPKDGSVLLITVPDAAKAAFTAQDMGGKGLGGAPGIVATPTGLILTVAGVASPPGEIYCKTWDDAAGWTDWVDLQGVAG